MRGGVVRTYSRGKQRKKKAESTYRAKISARGYLNAPAMIRNVGRLVLNPATPAKNPRTLFSDFSFVPQAQHRLPVRATSFRAKREHHCRPAAQMNEVEALPQMMLRQVANDVGLRPMMFASAMM